MHRFTLGLLLACILPFPAHAGDDESSASYQRSAMPPTMWGWPCLKDEGAVRRKEFCVFVFAPSGRFLDPNLYKPLPPLPAFPPALPKPQ